MLPSRAEPKPLIWRATSKADFMTFPATVQREMGYALFRAQMGARHPIMAKMLKGFGGGAVMEIKESHQGNAYRAVYAVRYADAIFVLHAFQKKAKKGIATPKAEMELVRRPWADLTTDMEKRK